MRQARLRRELARPQSDAGRQTRHGVTHLLELRLVTGTRRARLGVAAAVNSVPQTAHVAFCGKYDILLQATLGRRGVPVEQAFHLLRPAFG